MKTHTFAKACSYALVAAMTLVFSCKDEDRLTVADAQDISEEAMTDSYYQDIDDVGSVSVAAPSEAAYTGVSRIATTITVNDDRFKCATVTLELTKASGDQPEGTITVDFGAGCTDAKGNVRTGKLLFAYKGKRFLPGATIVTTPQNYTINGIKLEGTRTVTNISTSTVDVPKFNAELTGGKATFPDGSVATRNSDITWTWDKTKTPNQLVIDQASTASGTTRGGRSYAVSLQKALKYQRFCGIAVEGIKKYVIDGSKEITIDYGDGTCDKAVVITVNGVTRNLTVN